MKTIFVTILFIFLCSIASFCFSQESMPNNHNQPETMTDDRLLERYLQESEKLKEKFIPIFERLKKEAVTKVERRLGMHDPERWLREYDHPLFVAAKQAMKRIAGTDNYLELWENRTLGRIKDIVFIKVLIGSSDQHRPRDDDSIPGSLFSGSVSLLTLYTLAVVNENHKELIQGIFVPVYDYGDSGPPLMAPKPVEKVLWVPLTFPSIALSNATYDSSWEVMAIYSFKNDRARDIMFNLATSSDEKDAFMADWAAYYLPFFPNSGELLPKLEPLIEEAEMTEQRDQKVIAALQERWKTHPFGSDREATIQDRELTKAIANRRQAFDRLLTLKRSLEFNERIPTEERERFDIFRRELAISWSLCNKTSIRGPSTSAVLKKGDEHFEIYLAEYSLPDRIPRGIRWEEYYDPPYPQVGINRQKRKEFYERELANPRPIYTENQMEYIRNRIKELERFP